MHDKRRDPSEADALEFFAQMRTTLKVMAVDEHDAKLVVGGAMAIIGALYGINHAEGAASAFMQMWYEEREVKDPKVVDLDRFRKNHTRSSWESETDLASAKGEMYHRRNPN